MAPMRCDGTGMAWAWHGAVTTDKGEQTCNMQVVTCNDSQGKTSNGPPRAPPQAPPFSPPYAGKKWRFGSMPAALG